MSKQGIALRPQEFADCLDVCEPDPRFLQGFNRIRDHFAPHAKAREASRSPSDVSAKDIEAQMLQLYFRVTVWARMQLTAGSLKESFLTVPTDGDAGKVDWDERPDTPGDDTVAG